MKKSTCFAAFALLAACATPAPDLSRIGVRTANTFGPQCEQMGPTNTQAWGLCVARAYDSAVAAYGGRCSDWQLRAPSFADCVMNASTGSSTVSTSLSPGPFCIAMDVGGGVDASRCR